MLGVGINGKVVGCENRKTGEKFALKVSSRIFRLYLFKNNILQVLRDVPKARREVELHFAACHHKNIVRILDIYENTYNQVKCLLVVMECMQGKCFRSNIKCYCYSVFSPVSALFHIL